MVMPRINSNAVPMLMNNSCGGIISATGNMSMTMNKQSPNPLYSAMLQHGNVMNDGFSLVNVSDYQSVQALIIKASKIFNYKLKFAEIDNKNMTLYVTNLENGLTQLNNLVAKKGSPLDIMMMVHTRIQPNLLEAFGLQLRK
jgi:hypothetical protein